jgi:hypothetical protein
MSRAAAGMDLCETVNEAEIDFSSYTASARSVITAATADAAREGAAVTPLHLFLVALVAETPVSEAFRRAVGNVKFVEDEARMCLSNDAASEGQMQKPSPTPDSINLLTSRARALAFRPDPHHPDRAAVSDLTLMQALLESPAVGSFLQHIGLEASAIWTRLRAELPSLSRETPGPTVLNQSDLPVPDAHLWAVEYLVARPDGSQLTVKAYCSLTAASAVEASGIPSARRALSDRCRSVASSLGHIPSVPKVEVWFDDEGNLTSDLRSASK